MNGPWFDPNHWAWLPGTALGCLGGLWGSLAGILAPRGKAKGFVVGSGTFLAVVALGSGVAGLYALLDHQPYGVWYGLLLPGVIFCPMLPMMLPMVLRRYSEAEKRRMSAEDL